MALSWSWTPAGLPHLLTGGTGMGRDVMAGWGGRAEGGWIQTPEDVHHKGRGSRCPAGPGRTGLEEQHSRTAGNMLLDPAANQHPRPFCPRGGRTRVKPCCGGRGAQITGQVVRPPSRTIAATPPGPRYQVGPQNWSREWIADHPFNRLRLQPRGAGVELGILSFGLIPASTVPGLWHIPLD